MNKTVDLPKVNPGLIDGTCCGKHIYIYPQTGTFADPETHPLRGFGPFCRGRVLEFVLFLLEKVLGNALLRYILYTCPNM